MKWTIGMPCYNNFTEVYFTVQSLRMYHNLKDCEILVIDNFGDTMLEKFIKSIRSDTVRYEQYKDIAGVSAAKNRVFECAKGEFVLCMDSHIMIVPGALDKEPKGDDLVQGPNILNSMNGYRCAWVDKWNAGMWGVWDVVVKELPKKPFEIWAQGAGFFATRRSSWLGFHKGFRGFGGETGYIQEKYRKAGRNVWCYPNMQWVHLFYNQGRPIPYTAYTVDKVRNYIIGFKELGRDLEPIRKEFGDELFRRAKHSMEKRGLYEL